MIEETGIIRTVLDGDVDSFRLLVQRYQGPVIRMIKNIIDDHHICEDIVTTPPTIGPIGPINIPLNARAVPIAVKYISLALNFGGNFNFAAKSLIFV